VTNAPCTSRFQITSLSEERPLATLITSQPSSGALMHPRSLGVSMPGHSPRPVSVRVSLRLGLSSLPFLAPCVVVCPTPHLVSGPRPVATDGSQELAL
jgi:hypothetical protein